MPGARLRETPRHKRAFETWYASADRKFAPVARELGVSATAVEGWARNFGWKTRAAARDAKAAVRTEEKIVDKIAEMNTRHLKYADGLQKVGMKALITSNNVRPGDAVRAVEAGVKIERLVRDQPTEVVEVGVMDRIRGLYKPRVKDGRVVD